MDYKVLYRKYRPDSFENLVGQEHIKTILLNSIKNNKLAHAYIFTGPRGTGKTSTAKLFAKAINCTNNVDGNPCGTCLNCENFKTTPDIIEMDAASNNGVENIRDIIQNIEIAPTMGKYKIYIIDEVHMLSTSAWNAFLKTLEEPPHNVIFILATTEIQKVPITVLSRCQRFDFTKIDNELIKNNLIKICDLEQITYDENALLEISYLSEGCMRDALSILDQLSKISTKIDNELIKTNYGTITKEEIDQLYMYLIHNDIDGLINIIKDTNKSGVGIKVFINKILDNFIEKAIDIKRKNLSSNIFNQLKRIINSLNNLLNQLNNNSNGYLLLELEFISFINDESTQLSGREIEQIISREIISKDTKMDISKIIKEDQNKQIYNICDNFINIRVNNSFVNATKEYKIEFNVNFEKLNVLIQNKNMNELKFLTKGIKPQVVSDQNVLFVTNNASVKVIANSKLYDIESLYNSEFNKKYKMIFITTSDWNKLMENYDKSKIYEYQNDDEYINSNSSSVQMAEELFGNNLNIE